MTFKEDVSADIQSVFENEEELMELHMVDGKPMLVSIDDMELLNRERKSTSNADGIYKKRILLFVAGKTFGALPAANRILTLDKKKYLVKEAHNEDGMYSITLEVMQS